MSNKFEVKGIEYQCGKIPGLAQFHIARRLGPILGDLITAVGPIKNVKVPKKGEEVVLDKADEKRVIEALPQIAASLGNLSDENAEYILFGLLKVVTRKQGGGGWARVTTDDNNFMFQDIDMMTMIQIAVGSFKENLGGFIDALPSSSTGEPPKGDG